MAIRIDDLNPTVIPQRDHEFPAMRDGITVKLSTAQVLGLGDASDPQALKDFSNVDPATGRSALGVSQAGTDPDQVSVNAQPFVDVASATTTDIGAAASLNVRITGTVTITGFDDVAAGIRRLLRFAEVLTLTHNATSLILPSGANIVTAPGDTAEAISLGSGNWVVISYQRADGRPLKSSFEAFTAAAGTAVEYTGIPVSDEIVMGLDGISLSGTARPLFQLGASSGFVTAGYESVAGLIFGTTPQTFQSTAGFPINSNSASNLMFGEVAFRRVTGNIWAATGNLAARSSVIQALWVSGLVDLGGELDRIRITTTNGTDTFDAGSVNIRYR
jgi:hypothetical protein